MAKSEPHWLHLPVRLGIIAFFARCWPKNQFAFALHHGTDVMQNGLTPCLSKPNFRPLLRMPRSPVNLICRWGSPGSILDVRRMDRGCSI